MSHTLAHVGQVIYSLQIDHLNPDLPLRYGVQELQCRSNSRNMPYIMQVTGSNPMMSYDV